jgi:hypothetical protein
MNSSSFLSLSLSLSPLSSMLNTRHKFSFPAQERRRKKRDFFNILSYNTEIMKNDEQPSV